jgi:hypothetical protein
VIAEIDVGDLVVSLLILYVVVQCLIVLAVVVVDMVRSDDLSGVAKGLWAVALLFLPVIATVGYLIARGDGFGTRALARAADRIPPPVAGTGPAPPPPPSAPAPEH